MKPTIHTPSTLILGCYVGSQHAAIVGSLRDAEGALRPGIVEQTGRSPGPPWRRRWQRRRSSARRMWWC
jgi:hypothetical protein